MELRIACFGDIVGCVGRDLLKERLSAFVKERDIHLVIANGENMAGGSGLTTSTYKHVLSSGVDVVTTGDHAFRRAEGIQLMDREKQLLRPANYPESAVGRGHLVTTTSNGVEVGVVNVVGRVFMDPARCPFLIARQLVQKIRHQTPIVLVDIHAEATSEKIAMGWYLDGEATVVFGTHTHVQTADEVILPGGTGFISDLGMTGSHEGVLGRKVKPVVKKFTTHMPAPFKESRGWPLAKGALFTVEHSSGKCVAVERIVLGSSTAGPEKIGGGLRD